MVINGAAFCQCFSAPKREEGARRPSVHRSNGEEIRRLDLLIALRADSNSGKASRRDELLVQCFELMTETLDTQ